MLTQNVVTQFEFEFEFESEFVFATEAANLELESRMNE